MVHKRKRDGKDAVVGKSSLEAKAEEASDVEAAPEIVTKAGVVWRKSTEEERQQATQRAIEVIKKGLKDNPDGQKEGKPFFPFTWASEFKPLLGPYRKFVEKCSAFVVKAGDLPSLYTIHLQKDATAASVPDKQDWELKMAKAWEAYLHDVKKEDRTPEEFVKLAKNIVARGVDKRPDGEAGSQGKMKKKKAKEEAKVDAQEPPKKKAKLSAAEEESPPRKAKVRAVETDAPGKKLKKKKRKAAA